MYDIDKVRADFPILSREVHGKPLVYLDNGASAQKPQAVIDAMTRVYSHEYANVHRGLHYLSNLTTDHYEAVRGKVARFLNAVSEDEIVFTSGTTEAINLVSYAWAAPRMREGDEDRALDCRTSCQYRALALPARAPGGEARLGRNRARRQPRP